ncbi:MAG: hypothetical protein MUC95_03390, partial [Spirochaetes bacterium]|nr:hypothetical protein [Spirochaetota bacterium]
EYFSNSSRFLHRTFFSENGGMTYIVECKSPVWNFYKVEEIFNTAFASFGYLSVEKVAEAVEAKPSPEAGKKESIQSKKDDDEDLEDDENGSDEDADDELDEEDE